jgi:16S rRNA (cytidine1402-2'-O)-methyltransferase
MKSSKTNLGIVYLVPTPLGNLEDMTFRGVRVLKEVDWIYCEDTRRSRILLQHYSVEPKNALQSFHDHSSQNTLKKIKEKLEMGESIAYLTDAGMPGVSDPGFVWVRLARQLGAPLQVLPGPSAVINAFVASNLPSPKFLFHGFFPRTRGEIDKAIESLKTLELVHLFYEAPGRVKSTLEVLAKHLKLNPFCLVREISKVFEETHFGTVEEVLASFEGQEKIKGECVLCIMGGSFSENQKRGVEKSSTDPTGLALNDSEQPQEFTLTPQQQEEIFALMKSGASSKDTSKELSKKFGVPRKIIYDFIIRHLT